METHIAHFFNLYSLDPGMTVLAGSVILLLVVMVAYFKRVVNLLKSPSPRRPDQIRQWVQESEILCERLSQMLEERKEIARRLIAEFDLKIETLRAMMAEMDRKHLSSATELPRTQPEEGVVKMAEQGLPLLEIARQTGLSVGEIQFIMNLRKCQTSASSKTTSPE